MQEFHRAEAAETKTYEFRRDEITKEFDVRRQEMVAATLAHDHQAAALDSTVAPGNVAPEKKVPRLAGHPHFRTRRYFFIL